MTCTCFPTSPSLLSLPLSRCASGKLCFFGLPSLSPLLTSPFSESKSRCFPAFLQNPGGSFIACSASLRMTPGHGSRSAMSFQNPTSVLTVLCFISCECFHSQCASRDSPGLSQTCLPSKPPWCCLLF